MKRLLYFIILINTSNLWGQDTWDLQRCIDYAMENNLTIQQAELQQSSVEVRLKDVRFNQLPSLNGTGSYQWSFGRSIDPTTYQFTTETIRSASFGLSSEVLLFGGLRTRKAIDQANMDLEAQKEATYATKQDITLDITLAYLQVLQTQEDMQTAKTQLELANHRLSITQKLVDAGSSPEGDLLESKAQLANQELAHINADNTYRLAMLNLRLLLNLPANKTFEIAPINTDIIIESEPLPELETIYNIALRQYPALKNAEWNVASSEAGIAIAQGYRSPSLSLTGGINTYYSSARNRFSTTPNNIYDTIGTVSSTGELVIANSPGFDIETSPYSFTDQINENLNENIALRLTIPIFNKWNNKAAVEQAKIQHDISQIALEQTRNSLRNLLQQTYAAALAAEQRYRSASKSIEANEAAFEYAQKKNEQGIMSPLEYSIAQTNYENARINFTAAKYEYIFRRAVLDYYQGKPIIIN